MHPLVAEVARRLGPNIAVEMGDPNATLWAQEKDAIAKAIPKRQVEFASGRGAARRAFQSLGIDSVAIPKAANRAPIWPADVVGSITHTADLCFAAVGLRSTTLAIGVDAEQAKPLTNAVRSAVLRHPREQSATGLEATLIFSAKESTYKMLSPWLDEIWGFDAMWIDLDLANHSFRAILNRPAGPLPTGKCLSGIALRDDRHVVTANALVEAN